MFGMSSSGSFKKTEKFLKFMEAGKEFHDLEHYGRQGVDALSGATPRRTGLVAQSWGSQTGHTNGVYSVSWFNTNVEGGAKVALLIELGHGTGTGGYVPPTPYINSAVGPVMDRAIEEVWRQVKNA